ncbi:NXPE family member 3-like [Lethenteron reissneri]|uniref:NXPE family member 3-like n=1 Tax=Lethenteron reissneri TaxID=7753 RepID=UPI002AB78E9C|nr:NXPE family member 3-like [Lethenteron reissneri]
MMKMDSKSLPPSRIFRSWLLISLLALSALVFFVINVSLILPPSHKPPRQVRPEPSLGSSTPEPHDIEMDDLRQFLWWPSLPATPSFDFESSTSPAATSYRLLGGTRNFTVGDTLHLTVQARDHHGRDKRHGGDYFRIKVYSDTLRAGAFGSVLDHDNGSYTASVVLPWPGEALVDIKLVHSSEAVHIVSRLRDSAPNKIYFTGYFEKEGARGEATECNAVPHLMIKSKMCEFRYAATGHMWFCKKPRKLPCDTLRFHSLGGHRNILTKQENRFFSNNVSKVRIIGDPSQIEVQPSPSSQNLTNALGPCVPGHPVPSPSGFYLNDEWVSLSCKARPFPALQDLANCLSGKRFYMYGDSTIRQWFLHLTANVPDMKFIDINAPTLLGPLMSASVATKSFLLYRTQGLPFLTQRGPVAAIHYVANEIDGLPGGKDTVVGISLWAHFTGFPVSLYIARMRGIRAAVVRLLNRAPGTLVIFKSANTSYHSPDQSDWLNRQLDQIMRRLMAGLPVVILDAWEMTAAHRLPDNLHPEPVIIHNEIKLILAYVCPQ